LLSAKICQESHQTPQTYPASSFRLTIFGLTTYLAKSLRHAILKNSTNRRLLTNDRPNLLCHSTMSIKTC
jgi:hypothetical protein